MNETQQTTDGYPQRFGRVLRGGLFACLIGMTTVSHADDPRDTFEIGGMITVTKVTDGDSLRSGPLKIRLFGIDAPEMKQNCTDANGGAWACGVAARDAVREMVDSGAQINCKLRDVDRYGRLVMQCFSDKGDIADRLVRAGLALSYQRYSTHYVAAEREAKAAQRGMWQGGFAPPWEWRKTQ